MLCRLFFSFFFFPCGRTPLQAAKPSRLTEPRIPDLLSRRRTFLLFMTRVNRCQAITGLVFQAAVPKSFTMKMGSLSGHDLAPHRWGDAACCEKLLLLEVVVVVVTVGVAVVVLVVLVVMLLLLLSTLLLLLFLLTLL